MVFMHAILMDSAMNRRLATDLAARGFKVVLLDLPGHGLSDKPKRASYHRMDTYARHVVALLDHLGIDRAVIGGVSLGGNVSLMVAALAPGRVKGLVIEMPVLEWAVPAAALTFVPLLVAIHFARPAVSRTAWLFQRLPRTGIGALDSVMVGERADMTIPALVIGHEVDRVHPFHDAEQLARRLPDGRLIKANSVLELRVNPGRLTDRIAEFLDEVWDGQDIGRRAV
jgi:pimeloyl-ACP methyl ester carboxylesterase